MLKKVLSAVLALAMILTMAATIGPVHAIADETETFQPKKVCVIKEQRYVDIYWDREVTNSSVVANYELKNGDTVLKMSSRDMYFADGLGGSFTTFSYSGKIDAEQPFTLEIKGDIADADGRLAEKKVYEATYENFYKQEYVSKVGIRCIASMDVAYTSLVAAGNMIDIMLSKSTDIAEKLAENGAKMALYGPHENAYFIPEHRSGWDPEMYYVEGYGGNRWNNYVSSIAEKNVIRVLEGDEVLQTGYRNENILIHEFGHCVKSGGMDELADQTLANEFQELFNSRKKQGYWPNTYAMGNSDEFFATMCAVWFNVMAEKPDFTDGVRCPVNTRAEMKEYDPETYEFFSKIFPDAALPAPWNPESIPDIYHDDTPGGYKEPPAGSTEGNHNFATDTFKIKYEGSGSAYLLERMDPAGLWWNYSKDSYDKQLNGGTYDIEADMHVWNINRLPDGTYQLIAKAGTDGGKALADADGTASFVKADVEDKNQLWKFLPGSESQGKLVNVGTGKALGLAGAAADGTLITMVDEESAPENWILQNLNTGAAIFPKAEAHDLANTYFQMISAVNGSSRLEGYNGVCVWATGDSVRNSWKIVPAGSGYFWIESVETAGNVLAPKDNGTEAGTVIAPEKKDEADATQLWSLQIESGDVRFVNKASGLAFAVPDVNNGTLPVLAEVAAKDNYQLWNTTNKTTGAKLVPSDIPNLVPEVKIVVSAKSVRLIEEDYIEVYWVNAPEDPKDVTQYTVTLNGKTVELDPNRTFFYKGMSSLGLKEPVADPEKAAGTLTVGETTYNFKFEPFYTQKVVSKTGFVVKSSSNVKLSTLQKTADAIDFMLKKRPDIGAAMLANGADVAIHGTGENAYYIPEFRVQTDPAVNPAAGLGGTVSLPTSCFAEGTVNGSIYVLVHEFGHALKALGVAKLPDKSLIHQYEDAFIHTKQTGLWPSQSYAISNGEEYFAEMAAIWFGVYSNDTESTSTTGSAHVNTREDMKVYDPLTYAVFSQIYPDENLPETLVDYSRYQDYHKVTEAPEVEEPEDPVDPYESGAGPEDYDLDKHYFKIYSYLGTNAVDYSDGETNTWWDYSNSSYGYNFDGLSFKVTKVGDYYRFTPKLDDTLALGTRNSGKTEGTRVENVPYIEGDDTQLWKLVQVKGYFCQLVNKASGLSMGTEFNTLPADGTKLELVEYSDTPFYSTQWRVIRLKDAPSKRNNDNLTEDKYCIRPVKADADSTKEFVERFYETILGRKAEAEGLKGWTDGLKDETFTGTDVAYGFILSPEYLAQEKSDAEFVQDLYQAFFGREAEEAGLKGWTDILAAGTSRAAVVAGFLASEEFGDLCEAHGIPAGNIAKVMAFVERMYTKCLGRDAEIQGELEWTALLLRKEYTGEQVAYGFFMSPEFLNKDLSDEDYVKTLYRTMFDREAEPEGLAGWLSFLAEGASRESVLYGFTQSVEFQNLCAEYGIIAY